MDKERLKFSLWYFAITMVIVLIVQSMIASVGTETLGYGDLKTLIKAGKVDNLVVGENEISGTIRNDDLDGILSKEIVVDLQKMGQGDHRFVTIRVADPALVQDMENAKVRFAGQYDSHWFSTVLSWVLPALIFVAIWTFAMKRMGGAGGMLEIGKSKAKVYMEKDTGVTFDDVAGIDEAKEELIEVVQFLKDPARYRRLGGKIPKGVLIVGSPGTGKTLLAKAVAGEAGVPFFSMSGSEFVEMFVGVGAARVRDLFAQAEERAPCIIFIDELDALGKARGVASFGGHEEREQTLNQLLVQMDGFDTNKGVIIMAATNRPEILDPALLRPGRFDRHVALDRPDLAGRRKILEVHAKNVKLSPAIDLAAIAARTSGFVGADLANLVNEAALLAARHDKKSVEMSDFDQALDRIVGGLEKKNRLMNAKEKETVSYHEAGHALVAEFRPNADRVSKISIIPRGVAALGYTQQTPTEDRYLLRRSELLDRLDVLLGGRVAEEIVFSDVSTGAQNDLQRATEMARQMVAQFGMSETLGLAAFEQTARAQYLDESIRQGTKDYSERTAQTIDEEVGKLLDESHVRVKRTLVEHRGTLNALAQLLLQTEVVDRAGLDALLAESTQSAMKSVAPTHDPLPLSSAG